MWDVKGFGSKDFVGLVQGYCPDTPSHEVLYDDGELVMHQLHKNEDWKLFTVVHAVEIQRTKTVGGWGAVVHPIERDGPGQIVNIDKIVCLYINNRI